jgi:hypothetical protein
LGGNDQTTLDALKSLNYYDVRSIHKIRKPFGSLRGGTLTKLLNLELLEKRSIFDDFGSMLNVFTGVFLFIPALQFDVTGYFIVAVSSILGQENLILESPNARISLSLGGGWLDFPWNFRPHRTSPSKPSLFYRSRN